MASVTTLSLSQGRWGPALARRKGPRGRPPAPLPCTGISRAQHPAEPPGSQTRSISARSGLHRSWKRHPRLIKPLPAPCKTAQISKQEHFYKAPLPGLCRRVTTKDRVDVQWDNNRSTPLPCRGGPAVPRTQEQQPGGTGDNFIESNGVRRPRKDMPVGAGSVGSRSRLGAGLDLFLSFVTSSSLFLASLYNSFKISCK